MFSMILHVPRCAVARSRYLLGLGRNIWLLCLRMMCSHRRPPPTPTITHLFLIHYGLVAAATH